VGSDGRINRSARSKELDDGCDDRREKGIKKEPGGPEFHEMPQGRRLSHIFSPERDRFNEPEQLDVTRQKRGTLRTVRKKRMDAEKRKIRQKTGGEGKGEDFLTDVSSKTQNMAAHPSESKESVDHHPHPPPNTPTQQQNHPRRRRQVHRRGGNKERILQLKGGNTKTETERMQEVENGATPSLEPIYIGEGPKTW